MGCSDRDACAPCADNAAPVTVLVARPAPLVAMKRQSVANRGSAKEGTDLLDIVRLTTDPATAASVIDGLRTADDQLTADAICTHAAGSTTVRPHPATDSRHPQGRFDDDGRPRPCRRTPPPRFGQEKADRRSTGC